MSSQLDWKLLGQEPFLGHWIFHILNLSYHLAHCQAQDICSASCCVCWNCTWASMQKTVRKNPQCLKIAWCPHHLPLLSREPHESCRLWQLMAKSPGGLRCPLRSVLHDSLGCRTQKWNVIENSVSCHKTCRAGLQWPLAACTCSVMSGEIWKMMKTPQDSGIGEREEWCGWGRVNRGWSIWENNLQAFY